MNSKEDCAMRSPTLFCVHTRKQALVSCSLSLEGMLASSLVGMHFMALNSGVPYIESKQMHLSACHLVL